jgi:hypothetical protein
LVIGVAILIVLVTGFYLLNDGVSVSQVLWSAPDGVCGLGHAQETGFTSGIGAKLTSAITIANPNSSAGCTVGELTTTTSGFQVISSNTPFTLPPKGSRLLSFEVRVPWYPYDGPLNLDLR